MSGSSEWARCADVQWAATMELSRSSTLFTADCREAYACISSASRATAPNVSRISTDVSLRSTARRTASAPARSQTSRSEEHTSELQSLMRNSYAVLRLKKKKTKK